VEIYRVDERRFSDGRQEAGSPDHVRGLRLLQEGGGSGEVFSGAGRGSDAWDLPGVLQGVDGQGADSFEQEGVGIFSGNRWKRDSTKEKTDEDSMPELRL